MVNATLLDSFSAALQKAKSDGTKPPSSMPQEDLSNNSVRRKEPKRKSKNTGAKLTLPETLSQSSESQASEDNEQAPHKSKILVTDSVNKSKNGKQKKMARRTRKKKAEVEEELSEDELEMRARMKKLMNKKGVWEVSMNNGVVLGLYTGTPAKIGGYVCTQQQVQPKSLFFQMTKIREVPEVITRPMCCERKFQRRDRFCPLCGSNRELESKIPQKTLIEIYTDTN